MLALALLAAGVTHGVTVTVPAQRSFCPGFPEAGKYDVGGTTSEVHLGRTGLAETERPTPHRVDAA